MSRKTMQDLRNAFNLALLEDYPYIAVEIQMPGFFENEIIIHKKGNFKSKLQYYEWFYDEDLNHKDAKEIRIVDFDYADYVDELKWFTDDGGILIWKLNLQYK